MDIVSDLALGVIRASTNSITTHYTRIFDPTLQTVGEEQIARAMSEGYTHDLDDDVSSPQHMGFSHRDTTRIFYDELKPLLRHAISPSRRQRATWHRGVDIHIWGQDYDRRLRSLFPTGRATDRFQGDSDTSPSSIGERSRVSAVVQHSLYRSRVGLQAASTSADREEGEPRQHTIFLPSPFYVAYKILTDPAAPGSEVAASAALQVEIRQRIESIYGPLAFDYGSVTRALQTIENRYTTSKAIRDRSPMVQFLCHYFSMRGIFNMELSWVDGQMSPQTGLFERWRDSSQLVEGLDARAANFRLHPSIVRLPPAGVILNELEGLPLPIEGGRSVFQGGLRFSAGGDLVAAISGPFGAGKTSACLSLAASLAPLGFKTLHLTCEEEPKDIDNRLQEAAPSAIRNTTPLFKCISLEDLQDPLRYRFWFNSNTLRVSGESKPDSTSVIDNLRELFEAALLRAPIFSSFPTDRSENMAHGLPPFARPIIVVDGLHQLFREAGATDSHFERALRMLIDRCRELNAVFIFTIAEYAPESVRLDYLCDLVIRLDREGFDELSGSPTRLMKLLKARRQPARMGTHLFYISAPKGFRIKANVSSLAEDAKDARWSEPDARQPIMLTPRDDIHILRNSQVLVYGRGSSGKAGLGLFLLHRRPLPGTEAHSLGGRATNAGLLPPSRAAGDESSLALFAAQEPDDWRSEEIDMLVPDRSPYYEARTLVVSFLYPEKYYRDIARKLGTSRIGAGGREYYAYKARQEYRESLLPDRYNVGVISLYPGNLRVEELLSKVDEELDAAETRGLPYTGVLLDGIHNVFVQFPELEKSELFWSQLYSLLRRRNVTVVTTHTQIELPQSPGKPAQRDPFNDFLHARRQAAPLLSVLISSADYVFDLTAIDEDGSGRIELSMKSGLGNVKAGYMEWDRVAYRLGARQMHL